MTLDYLKPALMDDALTVLTATRELRGASMHLDRKSSVRPRSMKRR
jgi:acyl-CoA thioester hydrolase